MCVVIDANFFSEIVAKQKKYACVLDWLEHKGGRLVHGGLLTRELRRNGAVARYLTQLASAGRALEIADEAVGAEARTVESIGCQSDDPHIVALARLSSARTLCSFDQALHRDFKNRRLLRDPRGVVLTECSRQQRHLLRHTAACA
jgi:hypothetical protein